MTWHTQDDSDNQMTIAVKSSDTEDRALAGESDSTGTRSFVLQYVNEKLYQ